MIFTIHPQHYFRRMEIVQYVKNEFIPKHAKELDYLKSHGYTALEMRHTIGDEFFKGECILNAKKKNDTNIRTRVKLRALSRHFQIGKDFICSSYSS